MSKGGEGREPRAESPEPGALQPRGAYSRPSSSDPGPSLSPNQRAWRRFQGNRLAMGSGWFLLAVALFLLVWPWLEHPSLASRLPKAMTWPPTSLSDAQFQRPGAEHWFGTDVHGRDLLSRVLYGARISFLIGAVGAVVSLVIGVLWGAVAGYAGGRADSVLMRAVDVLYSLPNIIFVIVLIATLENPLKAWLSARQLNVSARFLLLFV